MIYNVEHNNGPGSSLTRRGAIDDMDGGPEREQAGFGTTAAGPAAIETTDFTTAAVDELLWLEIPLL